MAAARRAVTRDVRATTAARLGATPTATPVLEERAESAATTILVPYHKKWMLFDDFSGSVIGITDSVTTAWMACPTGAKGCTPGDDYIMTKGPSTYAAVQTWTTKATHSTTDSLVVFVWLETWQITSTSVSADVMTLNIKYPADGGNTTTYISKQLEFQSDDIHYTSYPLTAGVAKLPATSTPNSASVIPTDSTTSFSATSTTSGLDAGAKAGIGVGVSISVIFNIAIISWLLLRRRRRRQSKRQSGGGSPGTKPELAGTEVQHNEGDTRTERSPHRTLEFEETRSEQELPAVAETREAELFELVASTPQELEATERKVMSPSEVDGGDRKFELSADETKQAEHGEKK